MHYSLHSLEFNLYSLMWSIVVKGANIEIQKIRNQEIKKSIFVRLIPLSIWVAVLVEYGGLSV